MHYPDDYLWDIGYLGVPPQGENIRYVQKHEIQAHGEVADWKGTDVSLEEKHFRRLYPTAIRLIEELMAKTGRRLPPMTQLRCGKENTGIHDPIHAGWNICYGRRGLGYFVYWREKRQQTPRQQQAPRAEDPRDP